MTQYAKVPEWAVTTQDQDQGQTSPEYSWISFRNVAKDLIPLILEEWEEASPFKGEAEADPDWSTYFKLDYAGSLRTLVIKSDNKIVGFATFIINRNLHCNLKIAYSDTFYVLPAFRNKNLGINLFKNAIDKFKSEGINKMICHDPSGRLCKLFTRLDGEKLEDIYQIRI